MGIKGTVTFQRNLFKKYMFAKKRAYNFIFLSKNCFVTFLTNHRVLIGSIHIFPGIFRSHYIRFQCEFSIGNI